MQKYTILRINTFYFYFQVRSSEHERVNKSECCIIGSWSRPTLRRRYVVNSVRNLWQTRRSNQARL